MSDHVTTAEPGPGTPSQPLPTSPGEAPFRAGCRDALSVVVGYVPFALALGAALAATDVDPLAAWSSSWLVFAGAAQLVAVQLLDSGAGALVVIATALVVNARHLLYSASIAGYADSWPRRWRLVGAYGLADPVYALAVTRYEEPDRGGSSHARLHYLLGVAVVCWTAWQVLTAAGLLLGGVLPPTYGLTLATPLTFLLLLLPTLRSSASWAAATTGGLVALAAQGLPLGLNLLLGAAAGVAAGVAAGSRAEARRA